MREMIEAFNGFASKVDEVENTNWAEYSDLEIEALNKLIRLMNPLYEAIEVLEEFH